MKQKTITCLATLKNGITIAQPENEDREHLTLKEEVCEPESDGDEPAEEEDAEEDDDHDNFIKRFFFSSHCSVCLYLALFLVLIGSLVALIVISIQVVRPFTKVQSYLNGTCIPTGVKERTESCMCGAGCTSKFRCISVQVTYQDRNKTWYNSTIYENESTLGKEVNKMIYTLMIYFLIALNSLNVVNTTSLNPLKVYGRTLCSHTCIKRLLKGQTK